MINFSRYILKNNSYVYVDSNDQYLYLVGFFLRDDAAGHIGFYRNWALSQDMIGSGGNMSDLEKVNGNVILRYAEVFNDDTEFVTTIEKFVEILDRWEQLIKEKPQEIFITREGNEIILFGVGK